MSDYSSSSDTSQSDADPDDVDSDVPSSDSEQERASVAQWQIDQLRDLAMYRTVQDVAAMLPLPPSILNGADSQRGLAALHMAAYDGKLDTVRLLCAQPGIDVNTLGVWSRYTPMHYAALGGTPEVICTLKRAGADLNARDRHGRRPLETYPDSNAEGSDERLACLMREHEAGDLAPCPRLNRLEEKYPPFARALSDARAQHRRWSGTRLAWIRACEQLGRRHAAARSIVVSSRRRRA